MGVGCEGTEGSRPKSSFDLVINSVGFATWRDEWSETQEYDCLQLRVPRDGSWKAVRDAK